MIPMPQQPFDARNAMGSIRALVRVQTPPFFDPKSGEVIPGQLYGFEGTGGTTPDVCKHLISVTTRKRLDEPCGRFTLTLEPIDVAPGYTWADLIPSYSLVEIWMQRYPMQQELVLVMLGLTSAAIRSEQMSEAPAERQIHIHGRELSCIFVDQKVFYLPVPPEQLQPERVSGIPGLPPLFSEAVALLGTVAIDPQLGAVGDSPVDVLARFVRMCTTGHSSGWNKNALPLINLDLPISIDPSTYKPTQTVLSELLIFDEGRARNQLFDPNAKLPAAQQLKNIGVPLWNLMETWSDPHYQELFVRTVDLRDSLSALGIDRPAQAVPKRTRFAANELIFRKKPFAGRIDEEGNVAGTRDRGSQFDNDFLRDPMEHVHIVDSDIAELSVGQSAEQSLVNVYRVRPRSIDANADSDFNALLAPLIDDGTNSPASVRRFGPRLLKVDDYYFKDGGGSAGAVAVARARAKLLWYWHRYEPVFLRGTYTLTGNPRVKVGMRMTHRGRAMSHEFYVTGVTHTMVLGGHSPGVRFTTRVDVDRGWPIAMD